MKKEVCSEVKTTRMKRLDNTWLEEIDWSIHAGVFFHTSEKEVWVKFSVYISITVEMKAIRLHRSSIFLGKHPRGSLFHTSFWEKNNMSQNFFLHLGYGWNKADSTSYK